MMDATKLMEAATNYKNWSLPHGHPEKGFCDWLLSDVETARRHRDDACEAMAEHILSTVRPDDDEPVTVEKMATEPGWRCDQLIHGVQQYLHVNGFSVVCDNGVFRFRGTVLQTMRKVRLVAALGE